MVYVALQTSHSILISFLWPSVAEVSHAGEDHRYSVLVGSLDDLFIADASPGLSDGRRTGGAELVDAVSKWEERIRCDDGTLQAVRVLELADLHRVDAAHLAGSDRDYPIRMTEDDRIAANVLGDRPREGERRQLGVGGRTLRDYPRRPHLLRRIARIVARLQERSTADHPQLPSSRPMPVARQREDAKVLLAG